MSSKNGPNELSAAIKELRKELGLTQEGLAARLGISLPTVIKYENGRVPKGKMLAKIAKLAGEAGLKDLGNIFAAALDREHGEASGAEVFYSITLTQAAESDPVAAAVEILRNPTKTDRKAKLLRFLEPEIEERRQARDRVRQLLLQTGAMYAAYRAGKTDDSELARFFELPLKQVRDWKRDNGLK